MLNALVSVIRRLERFKLMLVESVIFGLSKEFNLSFHPFEMVETKLQDYYSQLMKTSIGTGKTGVMKSSQQRGSD